MMPDNNIIEKLKKLQELAKRGDINEKEVAQLKLSAMLKKYNLSISDIEGIETEEREFTFGNKDNRIILCQIILSVVNTEVKVYTNKQKTNIYVNLSVIDFITISEMYSFYSKDYKRQKEVFLKAFVLKNGLYPKKTKIAEEKELTQEHLELIRMCTVIEKKEFNNIKMIQ